MYQAEYSEYNDMNRYENLDSVETKILQHLIYSNTKHANNFWKLLKYNTLNALSEPDLTVAERLELVNNDSGYPTDKRVFLAPFVDDAWAEQCSSAYIFMERINPVNASTSFVTITVELVTHSKVAVVNGDGDPLLNEEANPNDTNEEGEVIVPIKNRESILVKSILAELNGLYLDGIGYLQMNTLAHGPQSKDGYGNKTISGEVSMPLFSSRSFYGHSIKFVMEISGVSGSGWVGF